MRIIVGIRLKNHVPLDEGQTLRRLCQATNDSVNVVRPWPDENTTDTSSWIPASNRVAFFLESNEPQSVPERQGWIDHRRSVWAWTGVLSSDVYAKLQATDHVTQQAEDGIRGGVGSYALLNCDENALTGFTNAHRSEALYWAETSEAILISNSAAVLNLTVNKGKPRFSYLGIASFIAHGLPASEHTLFSDVTVVPAGTKIVSDHKADVRFEADTAQHVLSSAEIDNVADDIAAGLVNYAKTLTKPLSEIHAAVTGGKDSRLVVSILKAAGVEFSSYTYGLPESGEAYIGRQVSDFLNVKHHLKVPEIRTES